MARHNNTQYSQNKSTVKNRTRRAEASEIQLEELKAQTATNTASSKFWANTFKPAIAHALEAEKDENAKKALEKEFRIQSNNVATEKRFAMNSHYSQLGARRAGNTTNWKAKEKYLIGQTRLFILKDTLMPPDAIVNSAEKRVRIGADGALTEEVSELDADGETDHQAFMSDEDKQKFMAFVSSEECDGIAQSDHWETVKRHWLATTQSIVNKIDLLNTDSFDTYVEQMCPAKFNEYLHFINGLADMHGVSRRHRVEEVVAAFGDATCSYKKHMSVDKETGLPIPPWSLLFRRDERVLMAIVISAQLGGYFTEGCLRLASTNELSKLPPPFHKCKVSNRKIPYESISAEAASKLLEAFESDDVPAAKDVEEWLHISDLGLALEDNEAEEVEDEPLDPNMLDLYWDSVMSYQFENADESACDIWDPTAFEREIEIAHDDSQKDDAMAPDSNEEDDVEDE